MIPHPWSDEEKYGAMMLQPQSYRTLTVDQFLKRFYPKKSVSISMLNSNSTTSRVVTVKVNALRIIQKCIKHSLGHCRLLSHGLHCHEWMVRFSGDKNPVMRYYTLKLFKSMMPFLNQRWRAQESSIGIISMITN